VRLGAGSENVSAEQTISRQRKSHGIEAWEGWWMAPFVFRCPNMGLNVQGWSLKEIRDDANSYEGIT
jgi:hypothetical protein